MFCTFQRSDNVLLLEHVLPQISSPGRSFGACGEQTFSAASTSDQTEPSLYLNETTYENINRCILILLLSLFLNDKAFTLYDFPLVERLFKVTAACCLLVKEIQALLNKKKSLLCHGLPFIFLFTSIETLLEKAGLIGV